MRNRKNISTLSVVLSIAAVFAFASAALGQQADNNTKTVNAQQSGPWTVGIDPAKNTVQLSNTQSDPLPVKVVGSPAARRPFQRRMIVTPTGNGFSTVFMPIPAGKRLVIENISAIVRAPEGRRMEVNYYTYFDNEGNGDPGTSGIAAITFHRIALTDQGAFDGTSIFTANHKVLVFAEEQIGTQHFQVGVQARLNDSTPIPPGSTVQAQITFSGYLEDLTPGQ